jgi:2-polyprenyl-3-methyl-5-hydroxy-6-metoxy-1,4-benzoquinol methylase
MHFIFAAYESGLLKALAAPCEKQTLVEKLHVKRPDLLDALLDVGLATKELGMKNRLFFIKGKRSKAIMNSKGDMLAAMIQANITYYSDAYRHAPDRLQGGELGDDLHKMGALVARFSRIAEPILKDFLSGIVSGRNPMRILDVGCGSGVFLHSANDANRSATGVGLDIDEAVIGQAKNNIAEWGLKDSFSILHGDVRHPPKEIVGPFDLITLFNILYYFKDEDRAELIQNLRAMLSPDGVLAVAMNCHSRGRDIGAANLNMVNCSLKGLTRLPDLDEIILLLKRCGFRRIDTHRFMPGSTFYGLAASNS